MRISDLPLRRGLAVAAGAFLLGLAAPAAAREVAAVVNGKSIALHSIPGNRLRNQTLTSHQIKRHAITGDRLKPDAVTGAQVNESSLGLVPLAAQANTLPPLAWHTVADFANGWHDAGVSYRRDAAYAIDAQGIVHLRGSLGGGTSGKAAFTLPVGLHPASEVYLPMEANYGVGELVIETNGDVVPANQAGSSPDLGVGEFSSLEGITFSS